MPQITNSQLKHLKSLSHDLNPVVMIGQKGLHDAVIDEIDQALAFHELIKIKIVAERDERDGIIQTICDKTGALPVQSIGQKVSLFRRNKQKPKIQFPK